MRSPAARRLAGRAKARQRLSSMRLCRLNAIWARLSPRARSPCSAARITRVSLNTRASPGRSSCGRSPTTRSCKLTSCAPGRTSMADGGWGDGGPGRTTKSRAASRGEAGSSAMRSSGRSKSKRSVRMAVSDPLTPLRHVGNRTPRSVPGSDAGSQVRCHLKRGDPVGVLHGLAALDLVQVFHALNHLAPHSVLLVEEPGIVEADEELAVGAVGVLRARHGAHAAHVRLGIELGGEVGIARAAGAGALGAAGLGHEAVDDAVEDNAVVETLTRQ